jgi:hypothetical protein
MAQVKKTTKKTTSEKPVAAPIQQSAPSAPQTSSVSSVTTSSNGVVSVPLDDGKIRVIAYEYSKQPKSWNDWVWLTAEAELKLSSAYTTGAKAMNVPIPNPPKITVSKINDQPAKEDIKKAAEVLAAAKPKVQDLHWYLAVRNYILLQAKKSN